ncbi:hypothetical protein KI688_010494 [Linnemannia hyalina]|uniref:Uncharacterized protein n=1 Tax=Linnemannia hyalina TaxID=64524 RepID=A0A9P7XYF6_9FUNG|nr:hypothetical protein KI688_010494 [Linnemannia hyalina]
MGCRESSPVSVLIYLVWRILALEGWSALSFHLDNLHSITKLTSLEVRTFIPGKHCFIPLAIELCRSYGLLPLDESQDQEGADDFIFCSRTNSSNSTLADMGLAPPTAHDLVPDVRVCVPVRALDVGGLSFPART